MKKLAGLLLLLFPLVLTLHADGPGDNQAEKVRPVPPPGIPVPDKDRQELSRGLEELNKEIWAVRMLSKDKNTKVKQDLLPDVEIFYKAVHDALTHNEFFNASELATAREMLKMGMERAKQLHEGVAPWTTATGLVVRGYKSKIDDSVQPYGLVVPASYRAGNDHRHRLDIWLHGRGEVLSELNFLNGRLKSPGEFTPANAFVLHPYGRYCNANKFAGEVDVYEALDHVRKQYPIDDDRTILRGFSMGGAGCWQIAAHDTGRWAAVAPGAGFAETREFLRVFQNEDVKPTWYEEKLWHMYDATDYALNFANTPTVAYSGEKDSQKQAADIMAKALKAEGIELVHLIGPGTGHSYHPQTREELNRRIDAIALKGRDHLPKVVHFTTFTLRFNTMRWVVLDGMEKHWERARIDAELMGPGVTIKTSNVNALTLAMPPGTCPLDGTRRPTVTIDGTELEAAAVQSDRSWVAHFRKDASGRWTAVESATVAGLHKVHGLQGPIDDAFLDHFVMVKPTGKAMNDKVGTWVDAEMQHAITHWRKQFRGEAIVKNDTDITEQDIAASNLVLWGDPLSNKILARITDRLPIQWTADGIGVGKERFEANKHVPVLICPNPLNPKKYVVLNSGFTYREYDYLNNARQVPRLPDLAIVDIDTPVSSRYPGAIVTGGFFDENWQWKERAR